MSSQSSLHRSKNSKKGAGAAGIGGGTLMVVIANTFPSDSQKRHLLMLLTPTVTIILSAIWLFVQVEIANYVQDWKLKTLVKRTRAHLLESLNNDTTSEEHREIIRRKLEEIELIVADRELGRIRELTPVTFADVRKETSRV